MCETAKKTDGDDSAPAIARPKRQISLRTILLAITFFCALLAQYAIQRAENARAASWMWGGNPVVHPDPNWNRTSGYAGVFNFVAICLVIYYYRRKRPGGYWIAAGVAAAGAPLAILIDAGLRYFSQ